MQVGIILQIVLMDLSTPQTPAHICFPNWLSGLFWDQKCTWVCTKYQRQLHNVEKKMARIFSFPLTYATTIGWLKLLSSSTLSSKKVTTIYLFPIRKCIWSIASKILFWNQWWLIHTGHQFPKWSCMPLGMIQIPNSQHQDLTQTRQ